jgi:hypothetical protein
MGAEEAEEIGMCSCVSARFGKIWPRIAMLALRQSMRTMSVQAQTNLIWFVAVPLLWGHGRAVHQLMAVAVAT